MKVTHENSRDIATVILNSREVEGLLHEVRDLLYLDAQSRGRHQNRELAQLRDALVQVHQVFRSREYQRTYGVGYPMYPEVTHERTHRHP